MYENALNGRTQYGILLMIQLQILITMDEKGKVKQ